MELKNVIIDTNDMTVEEMTALITNLKAIRARKGELRSRARSLRAMVSSMKEDGMVFVSNYTGEVLNPDDWDVYDEINQTVYKLQTEEAD